MSRSRRQPFIGYKDSVRARIDRKRFRRTTRRLLRVRIAGYDPVDDAPHAYAYPHSWVMLREDWHYVRSRTGAHRRCFERGTPCDMNGGLHSYVRDGRVHEYASCWIWGSWGSGKDWIARASRK